MVRGGGEGGGISRLVVWVLGLSLAELTQLLCMNQPKATCLREYLEHIFRQLLNLGLIFLMGWWRALKLLFTGQQFCKTWLLQLQELNLFWEFIFTPQEWNDSWYVLVKLKGNCLQIQQKNAAHLWSISCSYFLLLSKFRDHESTECSCSLAGLVGQADQPSSPVNFYGS